jgi:F0F1-type ATP synthase membrane subunit b/b'
MDKTLHALGGILLNGIPTFVLVLILNFYLRVVFFKPLQQTLHKRKAMTEGARNSAAAALEAADARVAEHEAALRAALAEVYEAQENLNRELEEQHAVALQKAHADADMMLRSMRAEIAKEAEAASWELATQSEILADQIVNSLLKLKGEAA